MNISQVENLKIGDNRLLKSFLDSKVEAYNRVEFIATDPIQVPHLFKLPEDIEIAGFFTAILSWGLRKTIISKATLLMKLMDNQPFRFVTRTGNRNLARFEGFCHRTFNTTDTLYFLQALKTIYRQYGGLRSVFEQGFRESHDAGAAIRHFRKVFFAADHPARTRKHVPDAGGGSSAKRLNMFLRWMVRNDEHGVDFGLWRNINPAWLAIPLDVHTGNSARKVGLLMRKQNDWKAVEALTGQLRLFDPDDPVKYDFALFGMGVFNQ